MTSRTYTLWIRGWGALAAVLLTQCSTPHNVSVGLGAYSDGIKSRATKSSGAEGLIGPLAFPLSVKVSPAADSGGFALLTDYTLLPRKSPEGQVKNRYLLVRVPYKVTLISGGTLAVLLGPQIKIHTQKGSGTSVALANGNSTSVFGTPSRSVTDALVGIDFGFATQFDKFLVTLESSFEGFTSSSKRNLTLLLGLTYTVN